MSLREVFNIVNEGEYFEYKGISYIRVGMCLVETKSNNYLMYGIDF